jgi:hypothetical protein
LVPLTYKLPADLKREDEEVKLLDGSLAVPTEISVKHQEKKKESQESDLTFYQFKKGDLVLQVLVLTQ